MYIRIDGTGDGPMKSENILLRVQPDEKLSFQQAADLAGISLSAWMRERLRKIAASELEEAGEQIPFRQAQRRAS